MKTKYKIGWILGSLLIASVGIISAEYHGKPCIATIISFAYLFAFLFYHIGEFVGKIEERKFQQNLREKSKL